MNLNSTQDPGGLDRRPKGKIGKNLIERSLKKKYNSRMIECSKKRNLWISYHTDKETDQEISNEKLQEYNQTTQNTLNIKVLSVG